MVNLSSAIDYHARRTPERPAIIYGRSRIGYGELARRAARVGALLHAEAIGPGDIVALLMKNSAAFLEISLAVSRIGAVSLPVNFRLAAEEVGYILGHAGAKLLFVDAELEPGAAAFPRRIVLGEDAQHDASRLVPPGLADVPPVQRQPDDLFRLMYTSGTTARPKGVTHTYANFYWKCLDQIVAFGLTAEDRLLVVGPLYHVGAFDLPGVGVWLAGGTLAVQREFDPADAFAAIEAERLTCGWLAPSMLNRMLEHRARRQLDLSSFRWCCGGGEKTPESRIRDFGRVFPAARYIDGYGLTESCGGDTLMEAGRELEKIGSTGRALAHVEVAIQDDEGRALPPGKEGEICLRGPKVTNGYWRDPEATARSFNGDWLRTGDVGYLDAEGFLFLTDRKKDMIISGGENIASSEVERVIYEHPAVSEAAVVGVADPRWGERPVAVVVLREGASLDYEALAEHCRARLAGFKVPSALYLRASLPRNPSGKVLKRVLRAELADGTHS